MSEKYYVIMEGEYSDKGVVGITTDLELAKAYCKVRNANYGYDCVEFWIWDEDGTELINDKNFIERSKSVATTFIYYIRGTINNGVVKWDNNTHGYGNLYFETVTDTTPKFIVRDGKELRAELHVYAEDEELADKIACDFLIKKNAEQAGL